MAAVAQLSFLASLPSVFGYVNLSALLLVFVLGVYGYRAALFCSFWLGLFYEYYSFLPFGAYIAGFLLLAASADILLARFFTNRSLYAFILLDLFLVVFYYGWISLVSGAVYFFGARDYSLFDWQNLLAGLWRASAANTVLVVVIFYIFNIYGQKLKTVFLGKT